jgi:hypothetical protein
MCKDLFRGFRIFARSLFEKTDLSQRDVDEVILVGQAASLLIEPSQSKVERIDLIDKIVLGVALEAAFNTSSFESKKNFGSLNYTSSETNVRRRSEKEKTFEDEPYNEPGIFKALLVAALGIMVFFVVLLVLGWSRPQAPPFNNEAQRQRPQAVTLNTGNSLNNYVAQIQGSSVRNRFNQTASESSYTENTGIHYLANLTDMLNGWNNIYRVKEDIFMIKLIF